MVTRARSVARLGLGLVALVAVGAVAGCARSSDPCSGVGGTCLTVAVSAPQPLRVDTITFDASGALTGTRQTMGTPTDLPLKVALKLPAGTSGAIDLVVHGLLAGSIVGQGEAQTSLTAGQHAVLPVELSPVGMPGGGDDLAGSGGDDLAGGDLATSHGPDLATGTSTIVPTAPVTQADLDGTGLNAITLPAGTTVLNADTGAINNGIRSANTVFTNREVNGGIAFHVAGGVGIFSFASLTIPVGAQLKLYGNQPVALVSASTIVINDLVEARPMDINGSVCAVPSNGVGGGKGGNPGSAVPPFVGGTSGGGMGGGGGGGRSSNGTVSSVGGGGGHADVGGAGAPYMPLNTPGGGGGQAYDMPTLVGFHGGSGGGGNGNSSGQGGAGGGAVQLVAKTAISVGIDTARGGVNAGGCGGKSPGGGGGSGGAILVESPTVQLGAMTTLAANGGGGAGSDSNGAHDGSDATFDDKIAYGGGSNMFNANGGNGGAGATVKGGATSQTSGPYAGGGAAGFIRINTMSGTPSMTTGAILSPYTSTGATSFGTIMLQ